MKTLSLETIALTILAIDGYNATVKYEIGTRGTSSYESSKLENVFITGLCKYRFEDERFENYVVGKTYKTVNNSKDFQSCPISLIRTMSTQDGEPMFAIKIVNEGGSYTVDTVTPKGNIRTDRKFKDTLYPSQWLRYADFYAYKKAQRDKELEKQAKAEQEMANAS